MRDRLAGIIGTLCMSMQIAGAGPAAAQSWPEVTARCRPIIGAMERLACYDRFAQPAAGTAPPAAAANPGSSLRAPSTAEQFGSESLPRAAAAASGRLDTITSPIQKFDVAPGGQFILLLANGQTWRQMEGDHTVARFHPGSTKTVKITRGAFGSYNLSFNDRSVEYKVVRLN